jgi:hypothetical protein
MQTVLAQQQKDIDFLNAKLKQARAGSHVQRVNAQLQLEKPARRIVHD